jgi:DNA polymerase-1
MQKPLILVDGSSYLYRAFHAMPALTNSKGIPTGAIYGMANMLRRLLNQYDPDFIAIIFDAKGKTFRDDLYENYKANRKEMPTELAAQIPFIHDIIKAMGLPIIMVEGVEADDVIGTLTKLSVEENKKILISTGDKDLAQLVNEDVSLVNTMTDTLLTPQTVVDKFGIPPHLIVDYLTLVGDSVDNIPGVPQVGPKTAVKWLIEFGSLDNIVANAANIKGKVGDNLRASLHQLPLAKMLATIKMDVALANDTHTLQRQTPDKEKLKQLYQELEFRTWLSELIEKQSTIEKNTKHENYEIIYEKTHFEHWLHALSSAKLICFDTETTSLNYLDAEIVGLSFAIEPTKAIYIPLAHDYLDAPQQLNKAWVLEQLKPILENSAIKKIGQNIKYDREVLANVDINLQGIYDTMLESYILNSSGTNHNMDTLALKYLGWRTITYADIAGKGVNQLPFNKIPIDIAATYAAEDADVTLQLHHIFNEKLNKEPRLKSVYEEIELPLISVLGSMERYGVLIDADKLYVQTVQLEERLSHIEEIIYQLAQTPFNINSPKQLQIILFEKLKLPILQKTPTGQASTADSVLQELALEFPLPKHIIEYRSLSKLITTYTKKLPTQIHPKTGRIHTSYNQTGAATGRLSSSDPNLQNIPIRTSEGRRIRQAFIAKPGYKIISADYSQIELRLMAHISEDANLLKAFSDNLDIHQATAAEILSIPLEEVNSGQRRSAKAINFGLIYGMSAFGLAKQLGVSRDAAQIYIDRYFAKYPGVKNYMENTRLAASDKGYVETLWGRRLYLPDIQSSQFMRRKAAERAAINAPLQGSAADIIKRAMISIDQWLEKNLFDAKMIMQVHDELVFEIADDKVEEMMVLVRTHMMNAATLKVPLLVSIGVGDNWDAASAH